MKKNLLIAFLLSVIFNASASDYEVQAKEDLIVAEDFGTYTFNVIEFTPIETIKLANKSLLNFTFSEEITTEPFQANYRKVFNGLCILIIKSKRNEIGGIKIIASSEDLKSDITTVISK